MERDISTAAVVLYKDYISNVLYLQVDASGNTLEAIAVQTNGAVILPRVDEEVEIHDRASAKLVSGKVVRVIHKGSLSSGPDRFLIEAQIYIE